MKAVIAAHGEETFYLHGLQEKQLGLATSGLQQVFRESLEENLFQLCRDGDHVKLSDFLQRQLYGVSVDLNCRDSPHRNTPLMVASKRGHGSVIKLLVAFGADATLRNAEGQTMLDTSSNGIKKVLWELASQETNPEHAFCPAHFHLAVWFGNRVSVDRNLARAGRQHHLNHLAATCHNQDGFNAMSLAVRDLRLLESFTRQSRLDYSPEAVVLALLGAGYTCTTVDPLQKTPLHWCAANVCDASVRVLGVLVEKGFCHEPPTVDHCGYIVVHTAARHGNAAVLDLLLQHGFPVNVQAKAGATPLHLCSMGGHEKCVALLLEHGAIATVRDADGQTALDVAKTSKIRVLLGGNSHAPTHRPKSSGPSQPNDHENALSFPGMEMRKSKTSLTLSKAQDTSLSPTQEENSVPSSSSQSSNFFTNRGLEKAKQRSSSPVPQTKIVEEYSEFLMKGRQSSKTFLEDLENLPSPSKEKTTSPRAFGDGNSISAPSTSNATKSVKIITSRKKSVPKKTTTEQVATGITKTPVVSPQAANDASVTKNTNKTAVVRKKAPDSANGKAGGSSGKKKAVIIHNKKKSNPVQDTVKHPDLREEDDVAEGEDVVHISGIGWRLSTALNLNDPSLAATSDVVASGMEWTDETATIRSTPRFQLPSFRSSISDETLCCVSGSQEFGSPTLLKTMDQGTSINTLSWSSQHPSGDEYDYSEEYNLIDWKRGNLLGHGSYGMVYLGMTQKGQLIAVKEVAVNAESESEITKIQEELEILKTLKHKHIVQYLGTARKESLVQIFMEYVPGGSIAALLSKFGPLEECIFQRFTRQVVEGVVFLHSNNIIHRDIKGANLMLNPNGVIKIIDFGCAKRLLQHASQNGTTMQQKSLKGSPYWMAPEVIMETGHGKKSDVWSIGCTVYEMATGKPPWVHLNKFAAIFAIGSATEEVPSLQSPPFSLNATDFVHACMTRDIFKRPNAEELRRHVFLESHALDFSSH